MGGVARPSACVLTTGTPSEVSLQTRIRRAGVDRATCGAELAVPSVPAPPAMWKEFKEFAIKGNAIDLAVGLILGAAFGTIVTTLVEQILMPPIGLVLGGVDFSNIFTVLKEGTAPAPYASLEAATAAGAVVIAWGVLINAVISFVIVAFSVFVLVKWINTLKTVTTQQAADEPAAPELTADQQLLSEIRDLLKARPL